MKKWLISLVIILSIVFMYGCDGETEKPPKPIDGGTEEPIVDDKYYDYATEVLLIDDKNNYIELLNCPITEISEDVKVFKLNNETLENSSIDKLLIGMNNVYVRAKNNKIEQIIIDGDPVFSRIRVAIRNSIANIADINTLYHTSITIRIPDATVIKTYDGKTKYETTANTTLTFTTDGEKVCYWTGNVLTKFDSRVIIEGRNEEMSVTSISRGVGIPSYAGNLELSVVGGKLLLTNDIEMEDYLLKVVPSEMPSSWNMEALKAQAISARTYAYREIINRKFPEYGYVVDDSESSQVYNNQNKAARSTQAIQETVGETMFNNGEVIVAYYYSGTSGLTGNGNEVWIEDHVIDEIPYLIGRNLTSMTVDTSDENSVLSFFKQIKMTSPGGKSSNHRWATGFTKKQLQTTLNANLPNMTKTYPTAYPQLIDGEWKVQAFPADIGEIQNIFVSERGTSGVVVSLTIEAANVTFKIINQYNIRFTIRPKDAGTTVTTSSATSDKTSYSNSSTNDSILKSGYFALEWVGNTLYFYGGGSGHGVGMCQYSANYYAAEGYTAKQILNTFYTNITFENTSTTYDPKNDFSKYFV